MIIEPLVLYAGATMPRKGSTRGCLSCPHVIASRQNRYMCFRRGVYNCDREATYLVELILPIW
jgi:hypothetical protein